MGRRLVDAVWIRQRMQAKDDRHARELAARTKLPTPTTRAERRRWAAEDAVDAERALTERPNIDPHARPPTHDRCNQSKYGTHRFVRSACEFCGRVETDCRVTPIRVGAEHADRDRH